MNNERKAEQFLKPIVKILILTLIPISFELWLHIFLRADEDEDEPLTVPLLQVSCVEVKRLLEGLPPRPLAPRPHSRALFSTGLLGRLLNTIPVLLKDPNWV
jgi:hypothetical protein